MSRRKPESNRSKRPTPDDLAGTPVCWEESEPATNTPEAAGPKASGRTRDPARLTSFPTADELAGVPVTTEGEEDLTIRPRKPRK